MKEHLSVILWSIVSLLALFIGTKLMGEKLMSQMTMFDYAIGISIGSIAAEMATKIESSLTLGVTAMLVYVLAALGVSVLTSKVFRTRKLIAGDPLVLLKGGKIYRENLKKAKLDTGEFLRRCRIAGYFDLSQLEAAVFESNGAVSFLPKATSRNLTPEDMGLAPVRTGIPLTVIADGKTIELNLKKSGRNLAWLEKELQKQGFDKAEDVFFATFDGSGLNCFAYVKAEPEIVE